MPESLLFLILFGLAGGLAVGVQAPLASLISQRIGPLESVFIVHVGGALVALLPLLYLRGGSLSQWHRVPWYALGAGGFGLVVIGAVSHTIPRLGVAPSLTLIILGQLLIGVLLDHFGLLGNPIRPASLTRLGGLLLLCSGVWLVLRG